MTASINFKARRAATWTCVPGVDSPDAGQVCLMVSSDPAGYMTPDNARALAADLLRDADHAEAIAKKAAATKVAP